MRKFLTLLFLLPLFSNAETNVVAYNVTNNTVIQGSLDSPEVSIASISKLMTVYTVIKANQDMDEKLLVIGKKTPNTKISKGMSFTRRELIDMALISSDNLAAITLSENFPGGHSNFVSKMNEHAKELEMLNSGFVEPTGLSPMNFSTVNDIIKLTRAVSGIEVFQNAAQTQRVVISPTSKKKRKQTIVNNPTINYFGKEGIVTIKTGFTKAAGFCITMLVNANNQLYNITVLGAKTKQERRLIVDRMLKEIYSA